MGPCGHHAIRFWRRESRFHEKRIFTVAALLGDERQSATFHEKWKAGLGGSVFHAADCDSGYGDFRGMPEDDRHRLHRELTGIVAASG